MTRITHDGTRWSNAAEDPIEIAAYDPTWPARFEAEAAAIRGALGNAFPHAIEHVGSTAVPGLAAKPIIDIVLIVPERERWPALVALLARLGYVFWDGNPDPTKMFFVKGMPPFGGGRTHHVHVQTAEAAAPTIRFRDLLRADPAEAARYGDLKRELAVAFRTDRDAYTRAKTAYVLEVLRKAPTEPTR
jgi:GrpB-like predicted nucleotidyltransferase (UPF0157 family)